MIVIYHNPNCGTSRNVVQITRDAGYEPIVIKYLEVGWTKPQLLGLLAAADLTAEQLLRTTKLPVDAISRLERCEGEDEYMDAMVEFPILVNRPIDCSPKGTNCVGQVSKF
tara:strand:+ start:355 stop:687 length:333 start_codon:yes stop_codon:yes gene_type:complete